VKIIDMSTPSNTPGTVNPAPNTPKKNPVKRFFQKVLIVFLLALVLAGGITYLYFNFTYSEGNRAGVLTKFSTKGFIFKTNEGELNVGSINSATGNAVANNAWAFSVKDKAVAEQLYKMEGKMIRVHYKEKVKNLPWQGETKYFVDEVEVVK